MASAEPQTKNDTTQKSHNNEETLEKLKHELVDMFAKDKIEANPELIFKMNQSLEIPITIIYKEKRILAITTNLALIREALASIDTVVYDKNREVVRPNLKPRRNILIVNKIDDSEKEALFRALSGTSEYKNKVSDDFFDSVNSYSLVLQSEQDTDTLYDLLKKQNFKSPNIEILREKENLYLNFLQKAQDSMKYNYQNYNYGYNNYGQMDPNMYYQYYYGGMYPYYPMNGYGYSQGGHGRYYDNYGYSKKGRAAEEEYDQEEEDQEGRDYQGYKSYGGYNPKSHRGRGGKVSNASNNRKKGYGGARHYKEYERKSEQPQVKTQQQTQLKSQEEITKRTRLDSENFPPLSTEVHLQPVHPQTEEKEAAAQVEVIEERMSELKNKSKIIRLKKNDIVEAYKALEKKGVTINSKLAGFDEETLPILEKKGEPSIESIKPKTIVREPRSRKTSSQFDIQRSPFQGAIDRKESTH